MKDKILNQVELKGECTGCGKKSTLTSSQILEGERDGIALSTCCFMPMVIGEVTFSSSRKKKK